MAKMELVACKQCGKERLVQRAYMSKPWFTGLCRDCSRRSRAKGKQWNGGHYKTMQGYIDIRLYPDDPYYAMTSKRWHYCREHRYVMAKHLGRCLSSQEAVHHINGIRDDNRIENLELISPADHRRQTMFCSHCELKKENKSLREQIKTLTNQLKEQNLKEWGIE